jgi:hypothetical protein
LRSTKHGLVAKQDSRRHLPGRRDSDYLDD